LTGKEILEVITSEGMMHRGYRWVPITCTIEVHKETEKAVNGTVTVLSDDNNEDDKIMYGPEIFWIPKSMCENVWFICTILYDEENKVSNKRWNDEE